MKITEEEYSIKVEVENKESLKQFLIELGYMACRESGKVGLGSWNPDYDVSREDMKNHFSGDKWFQIDYYKGRCVKLFGKIDGNSVSLNKFFDHDHHTGALKFLIDEVAKTR